MLSLSQNIKLSFRKFKAKKKKSMLVILPITFLVMLIFISTTEAKSIVGIVEKSVFASLETQNRNIELTKQAPQAQGGFARFNSDNTDNFYTNADLDKVSSVTNVNQSQPISTLPINQIKTTTLFDGKTMMINDLAGLDSQFASAYTTNNFVYDSTNSSSTIPIVLNAADFKENYEDWGGKDSITIDLSQFVGRRRASTTTSPSSTPAPNPIEAERPNKTRSISYTSTDLMGKEFTLSFGGLSDIQDYSQTQSQTGLTFTKLTADELKAKQDTRQSDISKYWDYNKISTPQTYTFKVVGVIEDNSNAKTYVPTDFANKVMEQYLTNEIAARNSTAIPTTDLNSTYQGLTYDGITLQKDQFSSILSNARRQGAEGAGMRVMGAGGATRIFGGGFGGLTSGYTIPGLVIETNRDDGTVKGEDKSFDFSNPLPLQSTTILLTVNDSKNRSQVISDLNAKGYAYTDTSFTKQLDKLKSVIYTVVNIVAIVLMAITGLIILINMAKFVSDSRKEIGVFRALGNTKIDIIKMFMGQSILYVIIGYIIGAILAMGVIIGLSFLMTNWVTGIVNLTIGEKLPISNTASWMDFINFDFTLLGLYTTALIVITIIISWIPANNASKVSPITAIRSE